MRQPGAGAVPGVAGELRLRKPEHAVRTVAAVVAKLNLSAFRKAIQAREGVAGRDATDAELVVPLWLYAGIRGIGSARELPRRCQESAALRWLCGGGRVHHRMLSEFRTAHGVALEELLTQGIASLVDQELVQVSRGSQDGMGVRVSAGAARFRREERLRELLAESQKQVEELKGQVEEPEPRAAAAVKQKAAQRRAAEEKQQRLEHALAQLPELKQRQQERASRAGQGR